MLSRTFNSYICGFHYFRRYWSPEKAEKLICLREENNAFDVLAIKTCKEYGMIVGHLPHELSRTLKFMLYRGARILTVLTSWRLIELVEVVYSESTPRIALGSFWLMKLKLNVYQMRFEKRILWKLKKETRSYDIRDMLSRQNETDSKRSRAVDKDPKMIVVY